MVKDYLCVITLSKKESNKKSTKKGDKLGMLHEARDRVMEVTVTIPRSYVYFKTDHI